MVLSVRVNNDQDGRGLRFNLSRAERMPALFIGFGVDAVGIDKAALVLEDQRRQFKRDSVVLALVLQVLRFIPLVTHCVYT
jgi:hypothetical protein